ncbi:M56 family metallopeptidase [Planctomycetota bacterium]
MLCLWPSGYRIVVPFALWRSLTSSQRRSILRHELAHYERFDIPKSFIVRMLALAHWFNPMVWFAVLRIEESAEWSCDDTVRNESPSQSTDYVKALVAVAEHLRAPMVWTSAIFGGGLSGRIRRLLSHDDRQDSRTKICVITGTLCLAVFVHAVRFELVAQEPEPGPNDTLVGDIHTIDALVAGLQNSEQAIRSLSVAMQCERIRHLTTEEVERFALRDRKIQSRFTEEWSIQSDGRGWNKSVATETMTDIAGKETVQENEYERTFDGTVARSIKTKRLHSGLIDKSGRIEFENASLTRNGMSPFDFTIRDNRSPISAIIAKQHGRVEQPGNWNGHSYAVIGTYLKRNDGELRHEFWIDPTRGFLVARSRTFFRATPENEWSLQTIVESSGHKEVVPGVWLPSKVESQWLRSDQGETPDAFMKFSGTCSNWKVNREIPASQLTLEFPEGIHVTGLNEFRKSQLEVSQNFFVAPVTTEFQRWRLRGDGVVAHASVDATSFIDHNTGKIDTDQFDFKALRESLIRVRREAGPGTINVSVVYSTFHLEVFRFVEGAIKEMAKKAGFAAVKFTSGTAAWKPLPNARGVWQAEPRYGNDAISMFPIRTGLSRRLVNEVDFYIDVPGPLPTDVKSIFSKSEEEVIQKAVSDSVIPDGAVVGLHVVISRPDGDARIETLPHVQQDAELHRDAVEFLLALGFDEVRVKVEIDAMIFVLRYR